MSNTEQEAQKKWEHHYETMFLEVDSQLEVRLSKIAFIAGYKAHAAKSGDEVAKLWKAIKAKKHEIIIGALRDELVELSDIRDLFTEFGIDTTEESPF